MNNLKLKSIGTALAVAAGLYSAPAVSEQTVLTFWKAPHSPNEQKLWEPLISEFESKNPDIKIEHLITPWATWVEKYSAGFTGGQPPCVSYMVDWLSGPFAGRDQFVDLDKAGYSAKVSSAYPDLWDKGNVNGIQVGIPFATAPRMWMYNKDSFDKAGVDYPTDSWTWSDFQRIARELKANGEKYPYAIDMTQSNYGYQDFLPWLWNAGGDVLSADGSAARVGENVAIETLEFINSLMEEGLAPRIGEYTVIEGENLFMRGGVAMYNVRSSGLSQIRDEFESLNFGLVRPPSGLSGQYNFQDWGYYAIAKNCPNQEESWKWMEFITSKDVTERYLGAVSLYPARGDTNLFADDNEAQTYMKNMVNTKNFPIHIRTLEIMDAWWPEVESALLGRQSFEQASRKASDAISEILED